MEYYEICERLDILTLSVLDIMQQILEERQQLDTLLQDGFFNMAKSRYLMGSNCVSMLQIKDSDVSPLKKVTSSTDVNDNIEFESFKVLDTDLTRAGENASETLRRRGTKSTTDQIVEGLSGIELSDNSPKAAVQAKNPLKWFGVLVPQSLRSSQSSFQKAVSAIATIATLQSQLAATHKELQELKLKKSELVKDHLDGASS